MSGSTIKMKLFSNQANKLTDFCSWLIIR